MPASYSESWGKGPRRGNRSLSLLSVSHPHPAQGRKRSSGTGSAGEPCEGHTLGGGAGVQGVGGVGARIQGLGDQGSWGLEMQEYGSRVSVGEDVPGQGSGASQDHENHLGLLATDMGRDLKAKRGLRTSEFITSIPPLHSYNAAQREPWPTTNLGVCRGLPGILEQDEL